MMVAAGPKDQGFTLIEVLVAMGLFAVLGSLLLGLSLGTSRVTQETRDRTGVNEESRTAMERMTRELRQASTIDAVTLPTVPGAGPTSFTFWTDFDGDGARSTLADDPEVLSYQWDPTNQRLTLSAYDASGSETRPVLAADVTSFIAELRSSRWEYDVNGDGVTTWQELDSAGAPVGNGDGVANDPELKHIDLIRVAVTVQDQSGPQTYQTLIDLRNRN